MPKKTKLQDLDQLLPREKMEKFGVENLRPYELLAILLQTGTKNKNVLELSKEIIGKFALTRFKNLTLKELTTIHGINTAKACKILAAIQFSKIVFEKKDRLLPIIDSSEAAANQLYEIGNYKKEYLAVLYLNAVNQVIHKEIVSIGILDGTMIHPREIFEPALRYLAAYIIVAHNHPTGDLNPSKEDLLATQKLIAAGEILGISVLDHLIICTNGFKSVFSPI